MYEIRIAGPVVQFLVEGRIQHTWDESSKVGNIAAARAYLRAIGSVGEQVEPDGVSGWWRIGDIEQHVNDSLRNGDFKIDFEEI